MKAVQINKYGGVEVLEVNKNASKPSVAKGQVLVQIFAAAINPIDWKLRMGYLKEMVPLKFPVTLGLDFSGIVIEVGKQVLDFNSGDEVLGQCGVLNGGSGSFAEFAVASVDKIIKKPNSLNFVQAAAIPLAGASALQAIEDHIKLKKGQRILIHGGAGGIGTFAVQIAKAKSAYVSTTVSARDVDFVKSLGADEAIDYKNEKFEEKLNGFDAVFDTVGGEIADRSFEVLRSGGIIVSMAGKPNDELAEKFKVDAIGQNTDANPDRLARLLELITEGKVKVQIDKIFKLEQAKEAFTQLESGHPRGKVVLKIKD